MKNGSNSSGNPKYKCKACGFGGVFQSVRKSEAFKEMVVQAAQERTSSRGLGRVFGISHQTALRWIKKAQSLPGIVSTLVPAEKNDVLELDELWSFVCKEVQKRWVRIALCRRTRQVVSFHIGDRSEKTCPAFWNLIPENYRKCRSFSDFWEAYSTVIDTGKHQMVGKESGETAHVERWNNTLVGITRFASEFAASSEKPSRFLRATKCTNFICTCLSTT